MLDQVVPSGETSRSAGTESALRVADVLLVFTQGPPSLGVSEISRRTGLAKAVVHRILRSLVTRRLIEVDPGGRGYRLGGAAVALGARALRDLDLRRAAQPVLRKLRETTRETTTLSALVGSSRVYLDQFEGPQELKVGLELGRPHPLHAGASGKAMLAFLPESSQREILSSSLEALTEATVVDPDVLAEELAEIRRLGVAVSAGERRRGVGSISAPIVGIDGAVMGAISVCGPIERLDPASVAEHVPKVRSAAHEVSEILSGGATP